MIEPENGKGLFKIRYSTFVVPLVKAVQEQQTEIESLKRKIAELKDILKRNGIPVISYPLFF